MERKFKVIVADDERLIARNIARNIEKANESFQVISMAADGLETYEQAATLLPDVVFCDIKMPEMDGIALIRRIAADFPNIRTVIVSGFNDFEFAREALRNQAVDYLLKPINPYDLKKTLRKLETELLAQYNQLVPKRDHAPAEIVECVTEFLRLNYAQEIDFSAISDSYGFSSAYLSKIFKENTGTSPGRYLFDCRMRAAKKLLCDTDLSVKDIAEKVGYPDPQHFSKSFKQATSLSPAQYRSAQSHNTNSFR